jgi:hypothetical protein
MTKKSSFIDIAEASAILGLHRTQAIAVLGKHDVTVITDKSRTKHLYLRCRVEELRRQRECEKCRKESVKGKRSCYHCHNRYSACELTSGLCSECQARKLVKNFAHHGDCCRFPYDCERVNILSMIVAEYQLAEFERENSPEGI